MSTVPTRLRFSHPSRRWIEAVGDDVESALKDFLWQGLASTTRSTYQAAINSYITFCKSKGIAPWPATELALGLFVTHRATSSLFNNAVRADTIESNLAALRSEHIDMRYSIAPFESFWVKRIVAGIRRTEPSRQKKQAVPISRSLLCLIVSQPPGDVGSEEFKRNLNFDAAATIAFAGFLRMGEYTVTLKELASTEAPSILATKLLRGDITFAPNDSHALLRLRRSKTDIKHTGVDIVLARTSGTACPVLFLRCLFHYDPQPSEASLFNVNGTPLTREAMIATMNRKIRLAGITEHYTGHSFRRGAAQHAVDMGCSDNELKLLGRWTSEAFQHYVERDAISRFTINYRFQTGESVLQPLPTTKIDTKTITSGMAAASLNGSLDGISQASVTKA